MDEKTNNSPTPTLASPAQPVIDTGIGGAPGSADLSNDETDFSDTLRSIPWGKIVLGAVVLFLIVWGVVYLFTGNKTTPTVDTPIVVEQSKQNIALNQAQVAGSLLGENQYNEILQPNFSLDAVQITSNEPKVALLQASGVLEQTLNFDLFAHLAAEADKQVALQRYEAKLDQSLNATKAWLNEAANRLKDLASAINSTTQRQAAILREVNTLLVTDPTSTVVPTQYNQFIEVSNQIAVLNTEQSLLTQIIRQVNPLLNKASLRQQNITLNRSALLQGIRVVDLDDPGLKFVVEAN